MSPVSLFTVPVPWPLLPIVRLNITTAQAGAGVLQVPSARQVRVGFPTME
jgi:hypothetical protein